MKSNTYSFLVVIILTSILFSSCGSSNHVVSNNFIQKRKYVNGWHLNSNKSYSNKSQTNSQNEFETAKIGSVPKNGQFDVSFDKDVQELGFANVVALVENSIIPEDSSGCSEIVLKNGKSIEVKIIEVEEKAIKYEKCNDEKKCSRRILKGAVSMIKHKNGDIQEFKQENESSEKRKGPNVLSLVGIGFLIIGGVIWMLSTSSALSGFLGLGLALIAIGILLIILIAKIRPLSKAN